MLSRLAPSIVLLAAFAAGAHFAHVAASRAVPLGLQVSGRHYLPDGQALRVVALGQTTTLADLYWLKFVQYLGTPAAERAGYPQALQLGELVTDLDPRYSYAYMATGLVLTAQKRIGESNQILMKGASAAPDRWEIPFYLSFNYWYELHDTVLGAEWLRRTDAIPGRPAYVPGLIARLYSTAGQTETAIEFVRAMLAQAPGEAAREELQQRLRDLEVERDLQLLEAAIATYRAKTGHAPGALTDLIGTIVVVLPFAPDGSEYSYDGTTGEVSTPLVPKRPRVKEMAAPAVRAMEKP